MSSNNLDNVETLDGYYICTNDTDYDFIPSKVNLKQ